jgi:hypothetical protein
VIARGPFPRSIREAVPLLILEGACGDGRSPERIAFAKRNGNFDISRPRGPAANFFASSGEIVDDIAYYKV